MCLSRLGFENKLSETSKLQPIQKSIVGYRSLEPNPIANRIEEGVLPLKRFRPSSDPLLTRQRLEIFAKSRVSQFI